MTNTESQDTQHLLEQVAKLRNLEEGWLDGEYGDPITDTALARAEEAVSAMWACDNVAGSVFPTEDGGICLAWNNETKLTVDVQPDGSVYVHNADIVAGMCEDETIPADGDLSRALARWLS